MAFVTAVVRLLKPEQLHVKLSSSKEIAMYVCMYDVVESNTTGVN